MPEYLIAFLIGVASGLSANMLWVRRWRLRAGLERVRKPRFDVLDFDPASVGLFPINRWSSARPLSREKLQMSVVAPRPRQTWLNHRDWSELAEHFKSQGKSGDIGYLVDFEVDHHETEEGASFCYKVSHCDYWEHLATLEYFRSKESERSKVWELFQRGRILEFTQNAPPAAIKINVTVVSPERQFLAIQRSGAVEHKKGLWTAGPNETMVLKPHPTPGTQHEDLFGLAERCLREELALEPSDYGAINISWMGYDVSSAQTKVYAQVKSHLPAREVNKRMTQAHGIFEAQQTEWISITKRGILHIMENWESGDSAGRIWSASAPHALQELWRFRSALDLRDL
jgi:hypothetical protein